jgi:hypothetical protein
MLHACGRRVGARVCTLNAHARFVGAGESECACFMHVHGSQVGAGMHVVCMWQFCGSTSACVRRVGARVRIGCTWQACGGEYACFMHVAGVWERPSGSARCTVYRLCY